jgi:CBS domain-containing protein
MGDKQMNASDIMTRQVIFVGPDASVAEIVSLMLSHHIGALPVVKDGALVGIVSEGDLLRRVETGTEVRRSRWLEYFAAASTLAAEYAKSRGQMAADVMTRNVVSVSADTPIAEIAAVLETHRIKRVPVLQDGKLVGIVGRTNLLQALASRMQQPAAGRADDRQIRDALLAELGQQKWAVSLMRYNVVVENGAVHLWGWILSEAERKATIVAAENIPGVTKVVDHLAFGTYIGV